MDSIITVRGINNPHPRSARALIVGVLAVRAAFEDETVYDGDSKWSLRDTWLVHTIQTEPHVIMGWYPRFDDALVVADDMSRFSPAALFTTRTAIELIELYMTESTVLLAQWLRYTSEAAMKKQGVLGFREWMRFAQGREANEGLEP